VAVTRPPEARVQSSVVMTVRLSSRRGSDSSAPPTCQGERLELLRATEALRVAGRGAAEE